MVASVPAGHVYVRHLDDEAIEGPVRLPEPDPAGGRRTAAQGRSTSMLEADWVRSHDFDLFHLHLGFDNRSPQQLQDLVDALRERGRPLVQTVHDLRNPHHEDRALHDAQLDVLLPAAARVITLTSGAAAEIAKRWGREAVVLPHPHVVPLSDLDSLRQARASRRDRSEDRPFRVGLHLRSLRPSTAAGPLLPVLTDVVAGLPGAVLDVNVHRDVMTGTAARPDRELVTSLVRLDRAGHIELRVHDPLSDARLWDYLAGLEVSVLPDRFGTHSGWLEACRDLDTTVVAPTCGYHAEQGPVLTYLHDEEHFDAAGLQDTIRHAYLERPALGAAVEDRRRQRCALAAAHLRLYREAAQV